MRVVPGRSAQATAVLKKFQTILELVEEVDMLYFSNPGIGHFRVRLSLHFKARLSAKSLL